MERLVPAVVVVVAILVAGCGSDEEPAARVLSGPAAIGQQLVETRGCLSCHSTDGADGTGPTWKGLAGSVVELSDGGTARADNEYLRRSILAPDGDTVAGYPAGVMAASVPEGSLSPEEVDAIVAYLRTLAEDPGNS